MAPTDPTISEIQPRVISKEPVEYCLLAERYELYSSSPSNSCNRSSLYPPGSSSEKITPCQRCNVSERYFSTTGSSFLLFSSSCTFPIFCTSPFANNMEMISEVDITNVGPSGLLAFLYRISVSEISRTLASILVDCLVTMMSWAFKVWNNMAQHSATKNSTRFIVNCLTVTFSPVRCRCRIIKRSVAPYTTSSVRGPENNHDVWR